MFSFTVFIYLITNPNFIQSIVKVCVETGIAIRLSIFCVFCLEANFSGSTSNDFDGTLNGGHVCKFDMLK